MALSASTVWEIQTGGNDDNGGGFVTGAAGTDYSLVATKRTATGTNDSVTDAVANGTTTITSATANFTSALVGNIISLQGGTGTLTKVWKQVISVTNSTTIVLDTGNIAAGTGITLNIGGALASTGMLGGANGTINGTIAWIKAGTYTVTSASTNIAAGCLGRGGVNISLVGYQTTRGDYGTPPLIQTNGVITTFSLIAVGSDSFVANINLDGNSRTLSRGFVLNNCTGYKLQAINFTNNAFAGSNAYMNLYLCNASGCATQPAYSSYTIAFGCTATANTTTPFSPGIRSVTTRCIAYANTGATTDGFVAAGIGSSFINCVSQGNGRNGFLISANNQYFINCIAEGNTSRGFDGNSNNNDLTQFNKCAGFNNTTANISVGTGKLVNNFGFVTGTGSFFTNAAAGDFSLNNTAGAGAAARAVGIPGVFPLGLTTGYMDLGAAQHQDSGGGGSTEHSAVF